MAPPPSSPPLLKIATCQWRQDVHIHEDSTVWTVVAVCGMVRARACYTLMVQEEERQLSEESRSAVVWCLSTFRVHLIRI